MQKTPYDVSRILLTVLYTPFTNVKCNTRPTNHTLNDSNSQHVYLFVLNNAFCSVVDMTGYYFPAVQKQQLTLLFWE